MAGKKDKLKHDAAIWAIRFEKDHPRAAGQEITDATNLEFKTSFTVRALSAMCKRERENPSDPGLKLSDRLSKNHQSYAEASRRRTTKPVFGFDRWIHLPNGTLHHVPFPKTFQNDHDWPEDFLPTKDGRVKAAIRWAFNYAASADPKKPFQAAIKKKFNANGALETATGVPFSVTAIRKMLENPVYCGDSRVAGKIVRDTHPRIVRRETWNAVQPKLKRRSKPSKDKATPCRHLLGKHVVCAICGTQMERRIQRKYSSHPTYSYLCTEHDRRPGVHGDYPDYPGVKSRIVEDVVILLLPEHPDALPEDAVVDESSKQWYAEFTNRNPAKEQITQRDERRMRSIEKQIKVDKVSVFVRQVLRGNLYRASSIEGSIKICLRSGKTLLFEDGDFDSGFLRHQIVAYMRQIDEPVTYRRICQGMNKGPSGNMWRSLMKCVAVGKVVYHPTARAFILAERWRAALPQRQEGYPSTWGPARADRVRQAEEFMAKLGGRPCKRRELPEAVRNDPDVIMEMREKGRIIFHQTEPRAFILNPR